jgi:hypothetical protein
LCAQLKIRNKALVVFFTFGKKRALGQMPVASVIFRITKSGAFLNKKLTFWL